MKKPEKPIKTLKQGLKQKKAERVEKMMEDIENALPPDTLRQVEQTRDKGASLWLNAIPYEEHGFSLNKQEFRDSIRLRYNMRLKNLAQKCACEQCFSVNHALNCKKGGFVVQRHDNVKFCLLGICLKYAGMLKVNRILYLWIMKLFY